jgi:MerR family mercuric resistance operon transcriptional regulator
VNEMTKSLPIGELARKSEVNIETIRFYEKQGILPDPARTESGRRIYDQDDVKRLSFIHRCRGLGFSLKEIESLLSLVDDGDYTCKEVREITASHAQDVKQKISALRKMESVLDAMVERCGKGDVPECPIIEELFGS